MNEKNFREMLKREQDKLEEPWRRLEAARLIRRSPGKCRGEQDK
jgi:hypothetical protein